MKHGMEVGLSPGHVVLDGDLAHVRCGQTAGWIKMPLGMEVSLGPGDFVLDGDWGLNSPPKRATSPNVRPMSIVAKRSPTSATDELWFYIFSALESFSDCTIESFKHTVEPESGGLSPQIYKCKQRSLSSPSAPTPTVTRACKRSGRISARRSNLFL